MAEFLVMKNGSGMDALTVSEVANLSPYDALCYQMRRQPGDIVSVYPDGTFPDGMLDESPFAFVSIPDLSFEDAKLYAMPLLEDYTGEDGQPAKRIRRLSRYFFASAQGSGSTHFGSGRNTRIAFSATVSEKTGTDDDLPPPQPDPTQEETP